MRLHGFSQTFFLVDQTASRKFVQVGTGLNSEESRVECGNQMFLNTQRVTTSYKLYTINFFILNMNFVCTNFKNFLILLYHIAIKVNPGEN